MSVIIVLILAFLFLQKLEANNIHGDNKARILSSSDSPSSLPSGKPSGQPSKKPSKQPTSIPTMPIRLTLCLQEERNVV